MEVREAELALACGAPEAVRRRWGGVEVFVVGEVVVVGGFLEEWRRERMER